MARNEREMEKEIRRIEGQLLVAKQICRENLKEINHFKSQQENDPILRETNRLLSIQSLNSIEHTEQFNKLLQMIYEQGASVFQSDEQERKQNDSLLVNLSSNIAELESLFDYANNLFTQPITSVNRLDSKSIRSASSTENDSFDCLDTISLQNVADDHHTNDTHQKEEESIELRDLQHRIDTMRKRLINIHQCDDCFIQ